MIEVTEEMIEAFRAARAEMNHEQMHGRPPLTNNALTRVGLAAVLAIVERDAPDVPTLIRQAYERGQRDERALTEILGPSPALNFDPCGNPSCDAPWHQGREQK